MRACAEGCANPDFRRHADDGVRRERKQPDRRQQHGEHAGHAREHVRKAPVPVRLIKRFLERHQLMQGHIGIQRLHGRAQGRGRRGAIGHAANHQRHLRWSGRTMGEVHDGIRLRAGALLDRRRDADDRESPRRRGDDHCQQLPHRLGVLEVEIREALIDDDAVGSAMPS